jgi:hypothetical protein
MLRFIGRFNFNNFVLESSYFVGFFVIVCWLYICEEEIEYMYIALNPERCSPGKDIRVKCCRTQPPK